MIMQARTINIVTRTLFCSWAAGMMFLLRLLAVPNSPLFKARQIAESKGYVFFATHDAEIRPWKLPHSCLHGGLKKPWISPARWRPGSRFGPVEASRTLAAVGAG
jgi:hypothetical protein